jgi:hypothetical protein
MNNFPGAKKKKSTSGSRMVGEHKVYRQNQPNGEDGVRFSLGQVASAIAEGRLHPMVRSWTTKTLAKAGNPKGQRRRAAAILEAIRTVEGFPKASRWVPDPTASEYIAGAHLTLGDGDKPPFFALGDCFAEGTTVLVQASSVAGGSRATRIESLEVGQNIWGLDGWSKVEAKVEKGEIATLCLSFDGEDGGPKLTANHHVYVLDCRHHAMLGTGDEPVLVSKRACDCTADDRIEKRIRVQELALGMMLPAPARTPGIALGPRRFGNMRRLTAIAPGGVLPCWDIQTSDNRVYLAEHDVTVSQCDDLTVAFGSAVLAPIMYLAAAESVGAQAAVVGHAYGKDKMIEHVLGAIYDEGKWWYADPSVKDLPFGECKPFTRERVYLVPSMELLCDANVCLTDRGPAAGPPPPPRRGDFVSVNGAPGEDTPEPSWLTEGPSTLLGFCDLSGCCGEDDDLVSKIARAARAQRTTRPTVDATQRGIDDRHAERLNPIDAAQFTPSPALNPLNTQIEIPAQMQSDAQMSPTRMQSNVQMSTEQPIEQVLTPEEKQRMLDQQANQARIDAQVCQSNADLARNAALAHADKVLADQQAREDAAANSAQGQRQQVLDAAAAAHRQQCMDIAASNASEAHQAADIKAQQLQNQSCFQAWADAPCADNPLAWNIINVPPQTDYAAQELYQPWHDGLEPYSGESWEIKDSAFLQPTKKDV